MHSKNILSKSVVFFLTGFLFSGCNLQKSNPLELSVPVPRQVPLSEVPPMPRDQISFDVVKTQVFANHCLACHSAGGGNAGNLNLETYENFISKKNEVRSTVLGRTMPPPNAPSLKLSES